MQTELSINPELEKWIIPLTRDEFEQLTQSILEDGCREPLVVWGNTLVDGHNRYRICTKHGVPFSTVQKDFTSIDDVKNWMICTQLGRRNVTPEQRDYLIGKLYKEQKKKHGGTGANQHTIEQSPQSDDSAKTSERLADQFRVGRATVERAERFADALDTLSKTCGEDIKNRILAREYHVTKSDVIKMSKLPAPQQQKVMSAVQSGSHAKDAIDRVFGCHPEEKPVIPEDPDDSRILRLPCGNPRCKNSVITTKKQYREFVGVYPEKYGRVHIMYCCKECRDAHMFRLNARLSNQEDLNGSACEC